MNIKVVFNTLVEACKKLEMFFQGHGAFKNLLKESEIKFWLLGTSKEKEKITPVHCTGINVSPLSKCLTRRTVL